MKRLNDWGTRERGDRTQLIGENETAAAQRPLPSRLWPEQSRWREGGREGEVSKISVAAR